MVFDGYVDYNVLKFIYDFKTTVPDRDGVLEDVFMNGYCYYFALILKERFSGDILYDPIEGHFLTKIRSSDTIGLYDITGNVTSHYNMNKLLSESEWSDRKSIIDGCILKI